jgi:hypothetical protein
MSFGIPEPETDFSDCCGAPLAWHPETRSFECPDCFEIDDPDDSEERNDPVGLMNEPCLIGGTGI